MTTVHPIPRPDSAVRERWVAPRRALVGALSLVAAACWALVWMFPGGHVQPLRHAVAAVLVLSYLVGAVGTLRKEVRLDDGGLVIVRGFRRTRIPWTDVRELRVRGLDMGGGWIEAVRPDGRETVVPAPVEAFPAMRSSWERAVSPQS